MFSIRVDLGQRRDYSSVAVVEHVRVVERGFDAVRWWVGRHLERMPLGAPYTTVTARIVELAWSPKLREERMLAVGATGAGTVDLLRASQPGCANRYHAGSACSRRLKIDAEGVGEHDDLALAWALAAWAGRYPAGENREEI